MYKDGLVRFCTVPYEAPNNKNIKNVNQHLTNYAINKDHSEFEENDESDNDGVGNKRSITWLWKYLKDEGHETAWVKEAIKDVIVKTICSVQPEISH